MGEWKARLPGPVGTTSTAGTAGGTARAIVSSREASVSASIARHPGCRSATGCGSWAAGVSGVAFSTEPGDHPLQYCLLKGMLLGWGRSHPRAGPSRHKSPACGSLAMGSAATTVLRLSVLPRTAPGTPVSVAHPQRENPPATAADTSVTAGRWSLCAVGHNAAQLSVVGYPGRRPGRPRCNHRSRQSGHGGTIAVAEEATGALREGPLRTL